MNGRSLEQPYNYPTFLVNQRRRSRRSVNSTDDLSNRIEDDHVEHLADESVWELEYLTRKRVGNGVNFYP